MKIIKQKWKTLKNYSTFQQTNKTEFNKQFKHIKWNEMKWNEIEKHTLAHIRWLHVSQYWEESQNHKTKQHNTTFIDFIRFQSKYIFFWEKKTCKVMKDTLHTQ